LKAVVFDQHGGPEVLEYRDVAEPVPGFGEAIVRVHAVGLNFLDIFARRGMPGVKIPLPFISGGDISGEVASLSSDVRGWSVGERVAVNPKTPGGLIGEEIPGGLAEFVAVPATHLIRIPDGVDYVTAAAVPINFGTALRMLATIGRLAAGETVLILGASGGVGTACVQVAKRLGAKVIAAAGSAEKAARLVGIGADLTIDYSVDEDFSSRAWEMTEKRGVDVLVNFTGGDTIRPSLRTMARHGRLLICGATAGHVSTLDLRYLWRRELQLLGSTGYTQDDISSALVMVANGELNPVVGARFPLREVNIAQSLLESRNVFGKIVIDV
jgi:alcohol dehydrogenase